MSQYRSSEAVQGMRNEDCEVSFLTGRDLLFLNLLEVVFYIRWPQLGERFIACSAAETFFAVGCRWVLVTIRHLKVE